MTHDLVVIGGGPAGVAAAAVASRAGLDVVLVDGGARLGGQYFRRPAAPPYRRDLRGFMRMEKAVRSRARVLTRHRVWAVERRDDGFAVHCLEGDREERPRTVLARRLLVATGAYDRSLPFPGWDLPGVLTAGGAQALLKGDRVLAGRRVVVAGTGPFLLPVATGLAEAGARVAGVFEANRLRSVALRTRPGPAKVAEAGGYGMALLRHRVPLYGGHAVIAAHGDGELTHVTVARLDADWRPRSTRTVACDTLAVGYGFVPQLDLPEQLGCATRPGADGTPVVTVDAGMRTSVPGVYAAGESTGVGGADLARLEGLIAGQAAAADLGRAGPPVAGLSARRDRLAAFGESLQRAYPVRDGWASWLRPETPVCRCEEVSVADIEHARSLGALDARSVKLLARPGMGWCQGRVCGYAVACLTGDEQRAPRRPIAQPVRLGDLAGPADDS